MNTKTINSKPVRTVVLMLVLAAVAFASGCAYNDQQSIFDVKGPVAKEQLSITMITLWVSTLIFVVVGSLLIYAVFRFRLKGEYDPNAPLPSQSHGNTILEMVLTVISIGLLVVIATPTLPTIFQIAATPEINGPEDPLVVTVRGYQWWWSFTYENVPQKVVTANELRIPLGRKVLLRLESADVIHSFWVPKLAGKVDLIPNQHNEMWLKADEQGDYYGQCAEYCGTSHANMRFRVITMYPKEFEGWLLDQNKPGVTPPAGSLAAEGMEIFMKGPKVGQACSTCHLIKGTNAAGLVGPNLTHFASRQTMASGILDNSLSDVKKWLHNPGEVKPGNKMATTAIPPLELSNEEVNALAAYLEMLK